MNPLIRLPVPVRTISIREYETIKNAAKLIVADSMAPKVMQLANGNLMKFFRRKRLISSAMFAPYAIRFAHNAIRLKQLGILTITPVQILHCPKRGMHLVEYEPLAGEPLRNLLQKNGDAELLRQAARFIAELHDKGVYFRSMHFENILYDGERFGLIDVADMRIGKRPLNEKQRQRNFRHLLRYKQDTGLIDSILGRDTFMQAYRGTEV